MIAKCTACWITLSIRMTLEDKGRVQVGIVPHCPRNRERRRHALGLIDGRCAHLQAAVDGLHAPEMAQRAGDRLS